MIVIDGIVYSLQKYGGITVYFNSLLKHLSETKCDYSLLLYTDTIGAPPPNVSDKTEMLVARRCERYRKINIKADIFHSSYYRLASGSGVKNVTTVYDFTYERFVNGPRRWVHSWQKFAAIRGSDAIICISESTKRDLLEFLPDVDPNKIRVIYCGVNDKFKPLRGAQVAQPYVLFVGARSGYKNFLIAIQAVSLLPDLSLVCIGGGAFTSEEIAMLERFLSGRYRLVGWSDDDLLNKFYNEAACLLYPSSYEGFGIPVLEAMRVGCPVVAVAASSIPEVTGDAAELVDTPDPDLFASAIRRSLITERRFQLREMGFARSALFSWQKTFEQTMTVYVEMAGSAR